MIAFIRSILRRPDCRPEEYSAQVQLIAERIARARREPRSIVRPTVPLFDRRPAPPPGRSRPVIQQQ